MLSITFNFIYVLLFLGGLFLGFVLHLITNYIREKRQAIGFLYVNNETEEIYAQLDIDTTFDDSYDYVMLKIIHVNNQSQN